MIGYNYTTKGIVSKGWAKNGEKIMAIFPMKAYVSVQGDSMLGADFNI
jgi:hypothetical protein